LNRHFVCICRTFVCCTQCGAFVARKLVSDSGRFSGDLFGDFDEARRPRCSRARAALRARRRTRGRPPQTPFRRSQLQPRTPRFSVVRSRAARDCGAATPASSAAPIRSSTLSARACLGAAAAMPAGSSFDAARRLTRPACLGEA